MRIHTIILTGALAITSGSVLAKNEWVTIQGNTAHTGYLAITTNPEKMRVLWSKKLSIENPKAGDPAPIMDWFDGVVISDHTAYFTVNYYYDSKYTHLNFPTATTTAINTDTGNTVWQRQRQAGDKLNYPAISDDEVYVGVNKNNHGAGLLSYQTTTGKLQHSFHLSGWTMRNENNGPIAYNGNIYATSADTLESFDGLTGKFNWSIPNTDFLPMPAVTENYVIRPRHYLGGIEVLNKITGESEFVIPADKSCVFVSSKHYPVVDEKNNIAYYTFDCSNKLYAFDLVNHTVKWMMPEVFGQPVLAGDELYVLGTKKDGEAEELLSINAANGSINWKWHPDDGESTINGYYYPVATSDLVMVSSRNKTYALSRKTHQVVWQINKSGWLALGENRLIIINESKNEDGETDSPHATAVALN